MRTRRNKAFTLVEILIVVVILGILAAIVVPQFANATKDSQAGNLKAQIKEIQNQLELYKAREGAYPSLAELQADPAGYPAGTGWSVMIEKGYIKAAPKNPAMSPSTSTVNTGARDLSTGQMDGDGAAAWGYDEATGDFGANNFDEALGTVRTGL